MKHSMVPEADILKVLEVVMFFRHLILLICVLNIGSLIREIILVPQDHFANIHDYL